MPMINKLHPALNWRKGTIPPGCFGSSWKGCVLELLLNTWQCTPLLQVLLCVGTSGTATPSPPAWIHVELPAEALYPSCASMESQCGRCWFAAVQHICCLQRALPSIYFLYHLWHYSARILPGGDKCVDRRERAENQFQWSFLVRGVPQAKKGKHARHIGCWENNMICWKKTKPVSASQLNFLEIL